MEGRVHLWTKKTVDEKAEARENLMTEIREAGQRLENAYQRFELAKDEDLIESSIFEIEALKAQYRFLLKTAREQNVTLSADASMRGAVKEA